MSGSEKFNSKKLTYEMEEPAFLRRLRQEQSGYLPQRIIAPRNKKRPVDEDEDAPAYVMEESGETISAHEFKALAASVSAGNKGDKDGGKSPTDRALEALEQSSAASKDNLLEAGVKSSKRKTLKVVGGAEDGTEEKEGQKDKKPRLQRKPKQKVKLSFQEDDKDTS